MTSCPLHWPELDHTSQLSGDAKADTSTQAAGRGHQGPEARQDPNQDPFRRPMYPSSRPPDRGILQNRTKEIRALDPITQPVAAGPPSVPDRAITAEERPHQLNSVRGCPAGLRSPPLIHHTLIGLLHPTGANDVLSFPLFVRDFFLSFRDESADAETKYDDWYAHANQAAGGGG